MTEGVLTALIGAFALLITTFITIYRDKLPGLWSKKTVLQLHGEATILMRIAGGGLSGHEVAQMNKDYPQKIDCCTLTLTESDAFLESDIEIDDQKGRAVRGKLVGKGVFEKGTVSLQYKVTQKNGQSWAGVMILKVAGMGSIWGHFFTDSFSHPGHINLGRIVLGPSDKERPSAVQTEKLDYHSSHQKNVPVWKSMRKRD